jgi:transposase
MMAQNDLVVAGIDVAKDKVDACIRSLSLRQTCPSTAQGHRELIAWLRKHQVNKAVMEASGGYERDWARLLREAGIEVRIVDPKRVRNFALSAGRLAKNDAIDAEMIAWFAETFSEAPGQIHDAAHEELLALVKARIDLVDLKTRLQSQNEHAAPGPVQKAHDRVLKTLAPKLPSSRPQSRPRSRPRHTLPSVPRSSRVCRASPKRRRRTSLQGCRSSGR